MTEIMKKNAGNKRFTGNDTASALAISTRYGGKVLFLYEFPALYNIFNRVSLFNNHSLTT